jgi:hypothetical protein
MPTDTVMSLRPAWPWAAGYAVMGLTFLAARWITTEAGAGPAEDTSSGA